MPGPGPGGCLRAPVCLLDGVQEAPSSRSCWSAPAESFLFLSAENFHLLFCPGRSSEHPPCSWRNVGDTKPASFWIFLRGWGRLGRSRDRLLDPPKALQNPLEEAQSLSGWALNGMGLWLPQMGLLREVKVWGRG